MEMVFRQRFTKLMFPLRDKVCRCSPICVKQSAFFSAERQWRGNERANRQARERVHRNICSFICSWGIIYIHVIAYASRTKDRMSVGFSQYKTAPNLPTKTVPLNVYTRLKRRRTKRTNNVDDVCWMIFTKQQRFVTLNDTPRNKLVSMKKQSENGNSYSPSSNKKKSIERCTVANKWKDGTRCHFCIRQF